MAIATITQWLAAPVKNYTIGLALYNQHGDNPLLKTVLQHGDSEYHLNRLTEALEQLNHKLQPEPVEQPEARAAAVFIPALETIPVPPQRHALADSEFSRSPEPIKQLYTQNSRLKTRADFLYLQVRSAPTPAARLELALAQLDDRSQINENWKEIKEYHVTGKIKDDIKEEQEKQVSDLSVTELIALNKNLPTYITKDKKKLTALKSGTTKYDKTFMRLQENTIKLKLVKERLAHV
ncbi:hypothetical protein KHS38_11820 [Mucilaginibacter sp. Bleaf8]|uniref:hypothetical protein n=1 Tax=Mucilaginibacter sp. Bleaf8 TaxID=2834430 RepID=UPI001BCAAAD3|nr:hypothetical protein [Mucilaginibacter sp. Bleaf8]MBS7565093.1 hypothetical protein [Mucilaginibacter sp. Bleaf8]